MTATAISSFAKPIKDKTAVTVAQFLCELMCRHGCVEIQINHQGREFVNAVSTNLHELTGVEQRVTSAYRPQSNGLVERQYWTIKNALVEVLDEKPTKWPYIIEGILFAHRVSRHSSTQYSPFYLLYNREPILPIDVNSIWQIGKTMTPNLSIERLLKQFSHLLQL